MAIDQKDLSAIARTVADLLAPQVREVAAELVAVRVEAATQGLRDGHDAALAQLAEVTKQINAERDAREAALKKAVEDMGGTVDTVQTYFTELLEVAKSSFDKSVQAVAEKLTGLAPLASLETAKDGLLHAINEVAERIPTVPPATVLVESGELSAPMREAMEIATKQLIAPMLESRAEAVAQEVEVVRSFLKETTATILQVKGAVIADIKRVEDRIEMASLSEGNFRTVVEHKLGTLEGGLAATKTDVLAINDSLPGKLEAHGAKLFHEVMPEALKGAKGIAVEIVNKSGAEIKVQHDELRKEVRVTIGESLATLPTLVEGQTENMLKAVLPTVKELVVETATATATTTAKAVSEAHHIEVRDVTVALGRSAGLAAAQERLEEALPDLTTKVHDSIVEKTILEVLAQGEDAGKHAADNFLAANLSSLKEIAAVGGTAAGANAGIKAANEMLPTAIEAANTAFEKALPGLLEKAAEAGHSSASQFLIDSEEVLQTHAREAGAAAGTEAGDIAGADAGMRAGMKSGSEMVSGSLPNISESILRDAKIVALETATDYVKNSTDSINELAKTAGREAGAAAALNVLPELRNAALDVINEARPTLIKAASESGAAAATTYVESISGTLGTLASDAGSEAGAKAALIALPDLQKAALAVLTDALPDVTTKAGVEGALRAGELMAANHDSFIADAAAAGAEAGTAAAIKTLPELQSAALGILTEAEPALLAKASQAGAREAEAFLSVNRESLLANATEAGSEAGMAAAVKAVPDVVEGLAPGIIIEARAVAAATAEEETTKTVNRRWDEVKEAVVTVAAAKAMQVATDAVPTLVAGQDEALAARLLPGATQAATATAKAIGEAAVALAREHAGVAATAAATAAAGALREQLLTDLDPTERVHEAVEAKIATVSKELGEAIADAVESHIKEELPRLHVMMVAKIQAEVDRIPRPEDGEDGDDGKDARVEPPLPHVTGKMYEQGSWVSRHGSVWVAARHTELEPSEDNRDWYCVVHGIRNITATLQPDLRTLCIVTELGDGTLVTNNVRLEVPVAKGVYSEKAEYQKRDIATFDGSWWEALKDGVLPVPGIDRSAWKLQIKHGANAPASKTPAVTRPVFRGDWVLETLYQAGEQVDHAGYRWMALKSTRERPPFSLLKSNDVWTMLGASV